MAEHRAFALKWRPAKFEDVVGQPHVIRTLTNELTQGKLGHAYLFAGPRGTGKTTCARILARAVNCEKGMSATPCGECAMCRDILAGRCLDVIEIDAASNRGIDEIRDLREVVRLSPARGRRKVFILDEAHMLTGAAGNAFLKTLEEPPAHVLFILATTNASDILPTIHSRCQRFDFHQLGLATVTAPLKRIAEAEGIKADEPALVMIAKSARGAMRDAQMLLEQSAAFAVERVTVASVRELLGLVESEWVERFLGVLKERDVKEGLALLDSLLESGRGLDELLGEVQEELRDALMRKLGAQVTPMASAGLLADPERAGWFTEEELAALLAHVRRAAEELSARQIAHPRIAAELAMARLLRRERAVSWPEVEEALQRVNAALAGGGAVLKAPAGPAPRSVFQPAGPAVAPTRPFQASAPLPPASSAGAPASGVSIQPDAFGARWAEVLERLKGDAPTVVAYLRGVRCLGAEGDTVILETASAFHRQGLEGGEMRSTVEAALSSVAGRAISLAVRAAVVAPPPGLRPAGAASAVDPKAAAPEAPAPPDPDWVEREPLVKSTLDLFQARVVDRKRPPPPK